MIMENDVRPIDANALAEELSSLSMIVTGLRAGKGVLREYMTEYRKSVLRIVDEAPTIDQESLRPVGRWHLNEDGKWACTCCDGLAVEHPDEPDKWQALTRCCPNCGARMKGASDNGVEN